MTHRIPMTHPDYEAAKSVCRRSDLFAVPDAAHAQTDITYRSGRREGEVTLVSEVEQNRQLDSTSFALLLVLCDQVHPVGGHGTDGRCDHRTMGGLAPSKPEHQPTEAGPLASNCAQTVAHTPPLAMLSR